MKTINAGDAAVLDKPADQAGLGRRPPLHTYGACSDCKCTDNRACSTGCFWVEPNLCSRCWVLRELTDWDSKLKRPHENVSARQLHVLTNQLNAKLNAMVLKSHILRSAR